MKLQIKPVGDCAALAVFGTAVREDINDRVMALARRIAEAHLPGLGETVPAFASLLVYYDPLVTEFATVSAELLRLAAVQEIQRQASARVIEVPVCYGGACGPDLPFVAQHAGLTEQQVISLHSGRSYRIFMLGFLPGFPYLGGLDERLFTPRLQNPRTAIPAGSVGIGGKQTGIYPMESPGGWQLIGRTPLCLFDPECPLPYTAGDEIRFVPITEREYRRLAAGGDGK
jgi:KipI family sensor histidine kinase inhibitor